MLVSAATIRLGALMCLGTACMCTFMLAQSCQLTGYKLRKKPTEDLCSGNKFSEFQLHILV